MKLLFLLLMIQAIAKTERPFIYGVTVDSVSDLPAIIKSLKVFKKKPTTRIVFDEDVSADDYVEATEQIHKVSHVMGELMDSYYVKKISTAALEKRTEEYLAKLGDNVDIWEIGNEINGEWLGPTPDVIKKLMAVYGKVKKAHRKTALTLYYNEGCFEKAENEMFTWSKKNLTEEIKNSLDYVFLSYYEDDCNNLQPDWPSVFKKLGELFPKSKIGFGETGTKIAEKKESYIRRYYRMKINHPRFVGGYFWWYFKQDMVPDSSPLLKTLNSEIN